jgi:nucleoid DNA-binding protein
VVEEEGVARLLDMPLNKVAMVTGCFLRTLLHEIVDNKDVMVDGFGSFRLREQKRVAVAHLEKGSFKKGTHGSKMMVRTRKLFRVWFKKSNKFRQALDDAYGRESTMEKYAVDTDAGDQEKLEKQAAAGCPECGQKLERQGKVLSCPTHGTEPFEKGTR